MGGFAHAGMSGKQPSLVFIQYGRRVECHHAHFLSQVQIGQAQSVEDIIVKTFVIGRHTIQVYSGAIHTHMDFYNRLGSRKQEDVFIRGFHYY